MAILSNINGKFAVDSSGGIQFSGQTGTSGYVLKSNGNAAPTWVDGSTVIGGPYLPLSGGTLTGATATASGISFTVGGALTGTSATFSGDITLDDDLNFSTNGFADISNTGTGAMRFKPSSQTLALTLTGANATFAENVKIGSSTTGTPALNADDLVIDKGASESGITIISTAASSIRFGDAANTSIGSLEYNHNSNYMRMIVNNAERMRIDSAGNVGIGVTPEAWTGYFPVLQIGDRGALAHYANDSLTISDNWYYDGTNRRIDAGFATRIQIISATGDMHFQNAPTGIIDSAITFTTRLFIQDDGNVGIGTTSPSTKLTVNGGLVQVIESGNTAFYGGDYVRMFGTQSYGFRNSGGSTIAQISLTGNSYFNGGNVGINNTTPAKKLEISSPTSGDGILLTGDGTGGGMATGNYRGIAFSYTDTDTSYGSEMKFEIPDTTNHGGQISFWTDTIIGSGSSIRAMTIDRNQNVGIGTNSPVGKLFVGPTWNTSNDGNYLYIKNSTPRSEYDPNIQKTIDLGITYSGTSSNLSGPDMVGLTLYNNAGIAGQFSPMLLFSGLEATPSQYKATMAAIYARSPLGTGDSTSWIDGELIFATAGAATQGVIQRMVISKQGNVGLKTNNPDAHHYGTNDLVIGDGSTDCGMTFYVGNGRRGEIRFDESTSPSSSRFSFKYDENGMDNNGVMSFVYNNTEMWRFGKQTTGSDMPKTLIQGNSSQSMSSSNNMNKGMVQIMGESSGSGNYPPITMQHSSNGNSSTSLMVFKDTSSSSFGYIQRFVNNSNTSIGSIRFTSGQNGVSFDTSSDYRLKEDLKYFKALEVISKVKVYDFKWKSDKSRSFGVMAHELKELIPQAVSGEKDALLEDGAIEVQGVDYSKVIPHLIQSIQELKTEIDILKNKPCKCNCK